MKKNYLFKTTLVCVAMMVSLTIRSQQGVNILFEMMDDPSVNFYSVQKYAEEYFKIHETEEKEGHEAGGYEQYKRWEAEMQYHIDEKGNRDNPQSYYKEYKKFQENYGNSQRSSSAALTWQDMGPSYWNRTSSWAPGLGRVDCIAIDPQNKNNIYIGSPEGGCWKTSNGGNTWASLTDGLTYMQIGAVAVDPTNSNTVYIGTSGAGMLKSTNGGTTLTQINTGYSALGNVRKIIVDPTNAQTVIIATSAGIYRSTNGGTNWTKTSSVSMNDLEFKPGSSSTVYASGTRFYKSTDNGVTFTTLTNSITRSDALRIAVTNANPNIVYAVQCNGNVFGSFFRSTDSGANFTETVVGNSANGTNYFGYATDGSDNSGQGSYNICIAASQTNANEVHIGGIITWRSLNGGNSFVSTTAWTYPNSIGYTHCDMHELVYVGNTLYVGSDGGASISTDQGDNFVNISNGLGIRMFYRLGCSKTNVDMIAAGAQDNGGSILKTSGWIDWLGADGMEAAIDPTNANIVYGSSQQGSMYRSTNGGASYSGITTPGTGAWTTPFLIDQKTPTTLIAGYSQIFKSTNSGGSWSAISNFSGTALFDHLAMAPSNSNYIYASRGATIYMTSNGGGSWSDISAGLGGATINGIDVHDSDPKKVVVALSGSKVYASTNGGTAWMNYSGNLPALSARCIVYENGVNEAMYVGTASGVYYTNKNLTGWVQHGVGLPAVAISEIEIQYTAKKVRVATYGRGIWQADQYATSIIAGFSSNVQKICANTQITYSDQSISSATSWKWTFPGGTPATSTLQNPTITYAASGTYSVKLVAENSIGKDSLTKTNYVVIDAIPIAPTTTGASRCGPGVLSLSASGSGTLEWFSTSSGGSSINIGGNYSPSLSTTTTYYVGASTAVAPQKVGPVDTTFGSGINYTGSDAHGLLFDVLAPCHLKTVKVYAGSAGNRTVEILDGVGGAVLLTKVVNIPIGESRITLDFDLTVGNQRYIKITGALIDLKRTAGGASFPFTLPGLVSITETDVSSTNPNYYYYFYDWEVTVAGCSSTRVAVTGTINTIPSTPTITKNGSVLTSSSATGNQWYLNGTLISGATNQNYTVLTDGNYTVVVTANGCPSATSAIVNVINTGVEKDANESFFSIYPNPNTGTFNVSFNIIEKTDCVIEISNSLGQLIYQEKLKNFNGIYNKKMDIIEYGKGVYMIKLSNSKSEIAKKVFVY